MHDLVIVSDLHLGPGCDPDTGRFDRLEDFFYDEEFSDFIDHLLEASPSQGRPVRLILNGDVFDFLTSTKLPQEEYIRLHGLPLTRDERKYGMRGSPEKAIWTVRQIVRGHRLFFLALMRLLDHGHDLVLIKGNHDAELFWPSVRRALYEAMAEEGLGERWRKGPWTAEAIEARVTYDDWFYYEPGRIYVEHGNQYEASNAFLFNLYPVMNPQYSAPDKELIDYPAGSLFVRFLYNTVKGLNPFATRFVSLEQYLDFLGSINFIELIRVVTFHAPFLARVLKSTRSPAPTGDAVIREEHQRRLRDRARDLSLPEETLKEIDSLHALPIMVSKYTMMMELLKPMIRKISMTGGIFLLAAYFWLLIFDVIQSAEVMPGGAFGKASLLLLFTMVSILGVYLVGSYVSRMMLIQRDPAVRYMADCAGRISQLMEVPVVSMGHTHTVDIRALPGGGRYLNSGTWTTVSGPWDTIRSKGRQFTFLHMKDKVAELKTWSCEGGKGISRQVILLEEASLRPYTRLLVKPQQEPTRAMIKEEP